MSYVTKYGISQDKLDQQFIDPDFTTIPVEMFSEWIERRADQLAEEGNAFMADLRAALGT
jgi:hypothetical protein